MTHGCIYMLQRLRQLDLDLMVRSCQFRSMRGNEVRTFIVLPDRLPISDDILERTCTWKHEKKALSGSSSKL